MRVKNEGIIGVLKGINQFNTGFPFIFKIGTAVLSR